MKKLACVILSMIATVTACKKSGSKEKTGCAEATETILNTVTAMNSKKFKTLQKSYGVESEDIDYLKELAEDDMVKTVMAKAIVEVDEDSAEEKKKTASCDAIVRLPDYEEAYEEADGDEDVFADEINGQKEKKYQEISLTLEFDLEDDGYTWTNASDVLDELFGDLLEVIEYESEMPSTDADKPTKTTATDNTDDSDPAPTSQDDTAPLRDVTAKKVEITEDSIRAALQESDPEAVESLQFYDFESDLGGLKTVKLGSTYSHNYKVSFSYYEFENEDSAKQYFEKSATALEKYCTSYQIGDDWGYVSYQMAGYTTGVYYSGKGYINFNIFDGSEECVDILPSFIEALCK
jgi:hypothetical protein